MYYFIGIKEPGMSALASVFYDLGYEVIGSDNKEILENEELLKRNIKVLDFNEDNIKNDMIIIRGNINDDNIELLKALNLNLKIYTYFEMVKKLSKMFQTITVAGSHGKKETTLLLAYVLNNLRGVNCLSNSKGYAAKDNKEFVLEVCEWQKQFLEYEQAYAFITNIDSDSAEYFEDINDLVSSYEKYANNAEKMVIACGDDSYTHRLEVNTPIFYYGLDDDNDVIAKDVHYDKEGTSFDVFVEDGYYGHFDLPIYGKAMLLNVLAVISFCYYERYEAKDIAKLLKAFTDENNFFKERIIDSNIIVNNSLYYPAELRMTIKALKQKYPDKDLVVILNNDFNNFLEDYAQILANVSKVYIVKEDNELIKKLNNAEKIKESAIKDLNYENTVLLFIENNS